MSDEKLALTTADLTTVLLYAERFPDDWWARLPKGWPTQAVSSLRSRLAEVEREREAVIRFLNHQAAMKFPGECDSVRSLALQKVAAQIEAGYHLDDGTTKSAALSK